MTESHRFVELAVKPAPDVSHLLLSLTHKYLQVWLSCEVLKARPDDRRLYIYGLFATISHLRAARNGVSMPFLFSELSQAVVTAHDRQCRPQSGS